MTKFMSKKRNVIILAAVVIVAVVACIVGVRAYAAHADGVEAERLAARHGEIDKTLADAEKGLLTLYADETLDFLRKDVTQEDVDGVSIGLAQLASDADMTQAHKDTLERLQAECGHAGVMYEVMAEYDALFVTDTKDSDSSDTADVEPVKYLTSPGKKTTDAMAHIEERLDSIEADKAPFVKEYRARLEKAKAQLADTQKAIDAIAAYVNEDGSVMDGVTKEQYEEVAALIATIENAPLKSELTAKADLILTHLTEAGAVTQEEAAAMQQNAAQGSANNGNGYTNNGGGGGYTAPANNGGGNITYTPPADNGGGGSAATPAPAPVWVVTKAAWTEQVPIYSQVYKKYCSECGTDITAIGMVAHSDSFMPDVEASARHGCWHSTTEQVITGYNSVYHPEEGYWQQ